MQLKRRNNLPPGVSALDALNDYTWYLNDLFEFKLFFLKSESNIATFRICMDATFFGMSRVKQFSPYRRNR